MKPEENTRLNRDVVIALCEALGHDPNRVSSINLYPDRVTVTYDHFITDVQSDDRIDVMGSAPRWAT